MSDLIDKSEFEKEISSLNLVKPYTLPETTTLLEVVEFLQEKRIGCLLLENNKKLTGVITERDFLMKIIGKVEDWREKPIKDYMTKDPIALSPSDQILEVIQTMITGDFRHLPIIDEHKEVVGILSVKDLLALLVSFFKEEIESLGTMVEWTYNDTGSYSEDFSLLSGDDSQISSSIFFAELKRAIVKPANTIDKNKTVQEAMSIMRERRAGSLLVMEYETKILGIITERDLLFKFFGKSSYEDKKLVTEFMTPNPHLLLHRHYLAHAINNMFMFKYRNTIVVNEDKFPVALVGLLEVFRFIALHLFKTK